MADVYVLARYGRGRMFAWLPEAAQRIAKTAGSSLIKFEGYPFKSSKFCYFPINVQNAVCAGDF